VSKHDIFKIPVTATIVSEEDFQNTMAGGETQTGVPAQNSRVRERLNRAIAESRQSQRSGGPELLTKKPVALDASQSEDGIDSGAALNA